MFELIMETEPFDKTFYILVLEKSFYWFVFFFIISRSVFDRCYLSIHVTSNNTVNYMVRFQKMSSFCGHCNQAKTKYIFSGLNDV
jgi:hypothetical protein